MYMYYMCTILSTCTYYYECLADLVLLCNKMNTAMIKCAAIGCYILLLHEQNWHYMYVHVLQCIYNVYRMKVTCKFTAILKMTEPGT